MKQAANRREIATCYPDDGGDVLLQNVYSLSTDYMALYHRI
jgi:hypothetical protein